MSRNVIKKPTATHPSYGVIAMERIGGYTHRLVGSVSGSHNTAIRLTIAPGRRDDGIDNSDDWGANGRPLVTVHLSMYHWAELLSLTGMGVYTPCTLVEVNGERMPDVPENDSKIERVLEESRAELFDGPDASEEARRELDDLRREIDALKVTKGVKAALKTRLERAMSKLREPAVVAHVAVERLGRHLHAAATEARMESRASNEVISPTATIDAAIGRMLPAGTVEDE